MVDPSDLYVATGYDIRCLDVQSYLSSDFSITTQSISKTLAVLKRAIRAPDFPQNNSEVVIFALENRVQIGLLLLSGVAFRSPNNWRYFDRTKSKRRYS